MRNKVGFCIAFLIGLIYAILFIFKLLLSCILYGKKAVASPKFRSRPKVLTKWQYGKSCFLHLQNLTMHCVANGDPSKPLLLLLHGFPEFWFSWRHQLNSELAKHFRVVAVDMRGYGDTDKPTGIERYRMVHLVDDVRQAILALGYTRCHLVGHDVGGAVAWSLAAARPAMVDRLVLLNAPHPLAYHTCLRSTRSQFFRAWHLFFFQLPRLPEWLVGRQDLAALADSLTGKSQGVKRGAVCNDELEAYKFMFSAPGALTGPINYFRASLRYPDDKFELEGRRRPPIGQPTLLVFGCRDRFVTETAARLSGRYCRPGRFTYRPVPGGSHWLQQDCPDLVNRLLLEHLLPANGRPPALLSESDE
ncbi:hypothetical protein BOX15_Mlig013501g1 [Macrostomum lignano]|uniref:AB hydrolase-1 domain-containing protein n=1 Tax=Macrostomum lignano TaxID=282301 RepID=A0A267EM71_9PLAT|nr:hypothetical protein BOX15_Mlig013501g1 [Macrostomum lignano]